MRSSAMFAPLAREEARARQSTGVPRLRRGIARSSIGALVVTFLFLASAAAAASVASPTAGPVGALASPHATAHLGTPTAPVVAPPSGSSPVAAPALAPSPAPSSGPGSFWNNTLIPAPTNASCVYQGACVNDSGSPSIASSGTGIMVTAYTAFTNLTACPVAANETYSEIGVTVSKDGGASWSAPIYLDNPKCSQALNLSSAFSPSVVILANGTFALAYIEYSISNLSCFTEYDYFPSMSACFLPYDDLVITYSYDNGTIWTTPQVLNATKNIALNYLAPVAQQPKLAAVGDTIYLAWTNFTYSEYEGSFPPSIGLNLRVSTNGGASWGSAVQLPIQAGTWSGGVAWVGYGPSLLINATGTLFVTYATDANQYNGNYCDTFGCSYLSLDMTESVVVARTSDNGSTFSVATVATNVPVLWNGPNWANGGPGSWVSPEPAIAEDPSTHELYVAYSGGEVGNVCYTLSSCSPVEEFVNTWVSNSTNGGANWSTPVALGDAVLGLSGAATADDYIFLPSIGVGTNGTVYVDTAQLNNTVCVGFNCGLETDLVFVSTDHGASFPNWYPPYPAPTVNNYPWWDGVSSSMVIYRGAPFMAWTLEICPGNGATLSCGAPFGIGWSQVAITSPYNLTGGVTVTFKETGLPAGSNWSAALSGNVRSGSSTTSLVVSSVPSGQTESWTVPWLNVSYGISYESTVSISSPGNFTKNTTITVTFTEQVLFTLQSTPQFPSYCFPSAGTCSNWVMSPAPYTAWVTPGSAIALSTYPVAWSAYTDGLADNMTFLSWTGEGPGNYTGLSPNVTITVTGPVNETANYVVTGYCEFDGTYADACFNLSAYPLIFDEHHLPAGTAWSVTIVTQNGTMMTNTSTGDLIGFDVPATPTDYYVWTVPTATTGQYWAPSEDEPSPVEPISGLLVNVDYTDQAITSSGFATRFVETGLPPGSPWSVNVGSDSYGVEANNTTLTLGGGGPDSVNGSAVYLEDGYGYYVASMTYNPYVQNDSSTISSGVPGSISIDGPGTVTFSYRPAYLLTTIASTGGTVTPGTSWFHAGTAVTLTESAAAGDHFVGWTGSGPGSMTTTTGSPVITPTGPVTEFATFRPNATPTWNLTVNAIGLPTGTNYSVSLGASSYAGSGTFDIGDLPTGTYVVSVPYVYYNSSNTTRFEPTGFQSSSGLGADGTLSITMNGSLTVDFQAQYFVTLESTPSAGGSIAPVVGQYWDDSGAVLDLVASPSTGWEFVSWDSTDGSVAVTSASTEVVVTHPLTIAAQFQVQPVAPPHVFGLTILQAGLPSGLSWNASTGATGARGVGASVTIQGLNGSYELIVPAVSAGTGTRWVANVTTENVTVLANQTVSITFSQQFQIFVGAVSGGNITPQGDTWVANGGSLALSATPNATSSFLGWTGTGPGSYTGPTASTQLTVSGPISELANFGPVYKAAPTQTSGNSTAGLPLALGVIVALALIGLVIGLLVGRRRSPPAAPPEEWQPAPNEEEPGVPASIYEETPETQENGPT